MRIRPDGPGHPAAAAAEAEAGQWAELTQWPPAGWADVAPSEAAVIGFFDPGEDLDRRARRWGYTLPGYDLGALAGFAAGLAAAEAEAWTTDEPHIATQAYEDRRFLIGDRILHWAVPWLDAAGRCYPELRITAHSARDLLLDVGDRLRPTPDLGLVEGTTAPGEDAYGPVDVVASPGRFLRSVWSGAVVLDATVRSLTGGEFPLEGATIRDDLMVFYEIAGHRWRGLAEAHPGSALLWRALAVRAHRTSARLADDSWSAD